MWDLLRTLFGDNHSTSVRPRVVRVATTAGTRPSPVTAPRPVPAAPPLTRQPRPTVFGSDHVGLVGFNDTGFVLTAPTDPFAPELLHQSQRLHERVGGQTNVAAGLRQAVALLAQADSRRWRRLWLLTDGYPYPQERTGETLTAVQECAGQRIPINTIGFGDKYDEALLRRISQLTHGRFVSVQTLRDLVDALVRSTGSEGRNRRRHQAETTVLCLDLSGSMKEPMDGQTKVAVVEAAVLKLLQYKQKCWS